VRGSALSLSGRIRSIGHGLLAAGLLLVGIYFAAAYLKGSDAIGDALNPFLIRNYVPFGPLLFGALLSWLGRSVAPPA
jgi:prepilin signal peptidase PulO-like enzyme (type II secretory pathway)